jgi:histidine triad (HIT) family protein
MNETCVICEIISGNEEVRIVRDEDDLIVYRSPAPLAPVHLIIAPKKHIPSLTAITPEDSEVISKIFLLVPELARENAIFQCGFRLIANSGPDADTGDEIPHLHFHFLGGTKLTNQLA